MRKFTMVVALMVLIGQPLFAAKRVTVAELIKAVETNRAKPDAEAAWLIGDLELTERLSAERLAELKASIAGEKARQTLDAVAGASQFMPLPASDVSAKAVPDAAAQRQMMGMVAVYVGKVIPRLPNFFATRAIQRFEETPQLLTATARLVPYEPLHLIGSTRELALYRNGREDAASNKRISLNQGLRTWGEFGPILGVVLVDAARSKLAWSRWEGSKGERAVFSYTVPAEKSHYEVRYCCVASQAAMEVANLRPFSKVTGYHGEMTVDPATGTVLRLTVIADLKSSDPVVKADILVDYGPVKLGGETYYCPVTSISSARAQTVQTDPRYKFALANQLQPFKSSVTEVEFADYHLFRSDARMLSAEETALVMEADRGTKEPAVEAAAGAAPEKDGKAEQKPPEPATEDGEKSAPTNDAGGRETAVEHPAENPVSAASEAVPEISFSEAKGLPDTPAVAPSEPNGEFTLRSVSRLVDVAVVAYDKHGHPVTDLRPEELTVFDDGKKQAIRYFGRAAQAAGASTAQGSVLTNRPVSPETSPGAVAQPRRSASAAPDRNTLILLIDASNLAWGDLSYARGEMLRFLKQLQAGDEAALYILRTAGFQVLAEPTADHALIATKLTGWMPTAQDVSRAQDEEQRNRQHFDWVLRPTDLAYVNGNDGGDPEGSNAGKTRAVAVAAPVDPQLRSMGSDPERDALFRLRIVARHLALIPGHKSLVWISSDNALADWSGQAAGREDKGIKSIGPLALEVREVLNEAAISIYPLDVSQLEAGGITADLENRLVQARREPLKGDPPPPPPNPTGRYAAEMHQDTHPIQATFRDLAEATGGRALRRAGDVAGELNGIAADGRAAYLVSFTPETPPDGRYHAITVKVAGRPDVKVRSRTGYLYEREPVSLKEKFERAVWQGRDLNEIGLTGTITASADGPVLKLNMAATDLDVAGSDGFWAGQVGVFVVTRDDAALHAKVIGRTLSLRLKPDTYQAKMKDGIDIDQPLPGSLPQSGTVRIIVVDERSGRIGTLTVPALKPAEK